MDRRFVRLLRPCLAAAFSFAWVLAVAAPADTVGLRIKIDLKPGSDNSAVLALAKEHGSIIQADGKSVVLELADPEYAGRMIVRLKGQPTVVKAEPIQPSFPGGDLPKMGVSRLERLLKSYKASWEAYEELTGKDKAKKVGEEAELPGVEYLEAYLHFIKLRAYPNDEVDNSGFEQAMLRRTSSKERFGGKGTVGDHGGGKRFALGKGPGNGSGSPGLKIFDFIGPRNLAIPYHTYYGLTPCNGRVGALAFDPTDHNIIYVGGAVGGVSKSTDGGTTWQPLADSWPTMGVSAIAIKPDDHNTVLAGTGDWQGGNVPGFGIMRSTDGGVTWTNVGAAVFGSERITSVVFDPDDPSVVLAGEQGGGVVRSSNGGVTWTDTTGSSGGVTTICWNADHSVIWAGSSGANLKKSTDGGLTWTSVAVSGVSGEVHVATSKITPDTLFVLASGSQKVLRSTDAGATWTDLTASYINGYNWSQAWYDRYIASTIVQPTNGTPTDGVIIGLIDVTFSKDGGTTWRNAGGANWTATYDGTAITHNDQHCFAVNPNDPNEWLIGNDGGAYKAVYNPDTDKLTYTNLNDRLGLSQFYSLASHPTNNAYVLGGTQDNASPDSFGNQLSWGNPGAGDGMGAAINPLNGQNQYHSVYYQAIFRTNNGFASQSDISPSLSGQNVPFVGQLWLDPNNGRYLYCNADYLNRYDATTNSWTEKVGNLQFSGGSGQVNAFAVAPGDSNTLYVGTDNGRVWRSSDFGVNWTRIDEQGSGGLPNRAITQILVSPSNKNDILVSLSGSTAFHVYRCSDASAGTPAWLSVSGSGSTGLPNVSANDIAVDNLDPATWYVATDIGIWRTQDSGATWQDYGSTVGIPNTIVNKLVANPATKSLFAATYGRGVWRLRDDGVHIANLTAATAAVNGGDSTTGTVTLDSYGIPAGTPVQLTSSDPAVLQVPATTYVPYESDKGDFTITTSAVGIGKTVTITAKLGESVATFDIQVIPPGPIHADSVTYENSVVFSGTLADTFNLDYQYLYWQPNSRSLPASGVFTAVLPTFTPTGINIVANVRAQGQGTILGLMQLWNFRTNSWQTFQAQVMNRARQTLIINVTSRAANFVDQATGHVKLRFQTYNTSGHLHWLVGVDSLEFRAN